jgi:RNA polymerase sigma-70 factor, ECF subfamily
VGARPPTLGGDWNWEVMRAAATREARRYLLAAHDVDEAVQEALVRAWRRRASCRGDDHMPWMRQIARNEALRMLDRRQRRAELELLDDETLLAGLVDVEAAAAEDELLLRMEVEQALQRLSVADRQLLALRYERDLSQPEVARMLGIPEGTVKIRLHRLRGRLRKALDANR